MWGGRPSSRRLPHLLGEDLQAHEVNQVISFDHLLEEADVYTLLPPSSSRSLPLLSPLLKGWHVFYCNNISSIFCFYCTMRLFKQDVFSFAVVHT